MNEEELLKRLIIENPKLPIVFMCSADDLNGGYYCTFFENFTSKICTIYKTDERIFDDEIDITEYYEDMYEDLTDEQIKKLVEDTEQYKAIEIYCN